MARIYYLSGTNSDLGGGADWSKLLDTSTSTTTLVAASIAASATEVQYGFTASGEPGANGATGNYSVEWDVSNTNSDLYGAVQLHRVNGSGAVQSSSSTTSEQQLSTAAVYTFTLTAVNLGTWSSGDRLRVDFRMRNSSAHTARSVTLHEGDTDSEIRTPFYATQATGLGALTFAGLVPTIRRSVSVAPALGALTVAGLVPLVVTPVRIATGLGSLAVAGLSPMAVIPLVAAADLAALVVAAAVPERVALLDSRYARPQSGGRLDERIEWLRSDNDQGVDPAAMIDEAAPDDADYLYANGAAFSEVQLNPVVDPLSSAGHVLSIRVPPGFAPSGTLTVTLVEGFSPYTEIAAWSESNVVAGTTYTRQLTAEEADTITDYTDLRVWLQAA